MALDEDYNVEDFLNGTNTMDHLGRNSTVVGNSVPINIPFVPLGIGIIVVTTFGILGNFLSALILSRKKFQSSYSVLTLRLTFADSVYLLTKLLRYGLDSLFTYYGIFTLYTDFLLPATGPYLRPITFTAHTASTYMTIAIAFDRYMAICRPAKGRKICTVKQARIISALVIVFAILYNVPRWMEFHTEQYQDFNPELNETTTRYEMQKSELRVNSVYRLYYIFWSYFIVMFIIPFVTLSVLNFYIWRGVKHIERSGSVLSSSQSRENTFALMLVGVVVVFLICNFDYLVLDLLDYFDVHYTEFWNDLGNFLLTVNSAVNFLIYCICGQKFRQELCKLLGKTCGCNRTTASHDINTSDGWGKGDNNHTTNIDLYQMRQK